MNYSADVCKFAACDFVHYSWIHQIVLYSNLQERYHKMVTLRKRQIGIREMSYTVNVELSAFEFQNRSVFGSLSSF